MKISGFTIIRNGMSFGYPFIESLKSLLPLVDELVINVGVSTDGTKSEIGKLIGQQLAFQNKKFVLFDSEWPLNDPEKKKGGQILAEQTNLALEKCSGDWCFYLQADEILHEDDLLFIRTELEQVQNSPHIDALILNYTHFYADFSTIQVSRSAYRREIRAIRNHKNIVSVGDAQGFRYRDGSKIHGILSKARIFHYGWVRPPQVMKNKTGFMDTLYHAGAQENAPATGNNYKYKRFIGLRPFQNSHPQVMEARIQNYAQNFDGFNLSKAPFVFEYKDLWKWLSGVIEKLTGYRFFEYKNYKVVKK